MSESESDALPLGYWAITRLILLQLFIFANTFWLLKTIILSLLLVVFMIEFGQKVGLVMKQNYGKILEVFIPNNEGIDSKNIGFKVLLDDGTKIGIIEEQDEFNSNIFRDDEVVVTRQTIDNKEFTDIEVVGDKIE